MTLGRSPHLAAYSPHLRRGSRRVEPSRESAPGPRHTTAKLSAHRSREASRPASHWDSGDARPLHSPDSPRLQRGGELQRSVQAFCEHGGRESVLQAVGSFNHFFYSFELQDRLHRSEYLQRIGRTAVRGVFPWETHVSPRRVSLQVARTHGKR